MVTKSGENGETPARNFTTYALKDKSSDEAAKRSVQGLTPKSLMYALVVFWGQPSLDMALRCVPDNCKRDSFSVAPPGPPGSGGGNGRNTSERIVSGIMTAAEMLKFKESDEQKSYFKSQASLAEAETRKLNAEAQKADLEVTSANLKLKREKMALYNEEISVVEAKIASGKPLSQNDQKYLGQLTEKRDALRTELLG